MTKYKTNAEYRAANAAKRNAAVEDVELPSTILDAFTGQPRQSALLDAWDAGIMAPQVPGTPAGNTAWWTLADFARQRDWVDAQIAAMVLYERQVKGTSWAAIGNALGVSRQAAQQRYGS